MFTAMKSSQVTCLKPECKRKNKNIKNNVAHKFLSSTRICEICHESYSIIRSNQVTCQKPECVKEYNRRKNRTTAPERVCSIKLLRLPGHECPKEDIIDGQAAEFDQTIIYLCPVCNSPFIPYIIDGNVIDKCPDCMRTAVVGKHYHQNNLQPMRGITIGGM
jgi:hypothetical protein